MRLPIAYVGLEKRECERPWVRLELSENRPPPCAYSQQIFLANLICDDLIAIAKRCEELADEIERGLIEL
jgi:hypothetical protein